MIDRIFLQRFNAEKENLRLYHGFIAYLHKERKKEITIEKYGYDIENYLEFLAKNNFYLVEVFEEEIEEYFFYLQESGTSTDLIQRKFSCLSTFYRYLIKQGWTVVNPMKLLKKGEFTKLYSIEERSLTISQVKIIRRKLTSGVNYDRRAFFELLISSGIKAQCLPDLKWSQVDFESRKIVNVIEKKDKVITVYFSEKARDSLLLLKKNREKNNNDFEYIFRKNYTGKQSVKRGNVKIDLEIIKGYAKDCGNIVGIKNLTSYQLRMTCGSLLMWGGMSIEDASLILNHKTDAGTVMYDNIDIQPILDKKNEIEKKLNGRWNHGRNEFYT